MKLYRISESRLRKEAKNIGIEDYGADPLEDGTYRMWPSGDIVDYEERVNRLNKKLKPIPDQTDRILNRSWEEINNLQMKIK